MPPELAFVCGGYPSHSARPALLAAAGFGPALVPVLAGIPPSRYADLALRFAAKGASPDHITPLGLRLAADAMRLANSHRIKDRQRHAQLAAEAQADREARREAALIAAGFGPAYAPLVIDIPSCRLEGVARTIRRRGAPTDRVTSAGVEVIHEAVAKLAELRAKDRDRKRALARV